MIQKSKQLLLKPIIWLAVAAAILYSSWPLGYILNPSVGNQNLASQLEAPHQPYNWLFIALDVLTGLVMLLVGFIQISSIRTHKILRIVVFFYMTFGALVAVAALSPLKCIPESGTCGPIFHQHNLLLHGFSSIFSVIFLLLSLVTLLGVARKRPHTKLGIVMLISLLIFWALFGIGSLIQIELHIHSNFLQDYFISICSISIVIVIATIDYLLSTEKKAHM